MPIQLTDAQKKWAKEKVKEKLKLKKNSEKSTSTSSSQKNVNQKDSKIDELEKVILQQQLRIEELENQLEEYERQSTTSLNSSIFQPPPLASRSKIYYELASTAYDRSYKPLLMEVLADSLNLKPLQVQEQVEPATGKTLSSDTTVVYLLYLPGPRFDSQAKWTRLGQIINSGAKLVICLFRCAAGSEPLEPMALEINPPYVRDEFQHHRLNMIEFMVTMQMSFAKHQGPKLLEHYKESTGKMKRELL